MIDKIKTFFSSVDNCILFGLLLIAAVLRFWNFNDLPLMHDELSALTRLEYDSFADFLHYGIKLDGHPAGVQLYLYFFTALFGYSTFILKLPFIVTGVFSVYLIYKIGSKWFSKTAGLIAAAFFVAIQYTIIYSVIIRPYGPGLFVSLLLVNTWTNIFLLSNTKWKNFIVFGVLLALCAYTHYFALLFATIVSLTGLLYLKKDTIVKYFLSGIIGLILFLPHFDIFFYQLEVGGVGAGQGGWLKAPTLAFIPNYLSYIFNYSLTSQVVGLLILSLSLFSSLRSKRWSLKKMILLVWFALPILIGYWYSVEVNPVLQYSVLLFSTPVFFLLIAGFNKEWKTISKLVVVSGIVFLSIASLQSERRHFSSFFNQPVGSFYDLVTAYGDDSTLYVGSHEEGFIQHYDLIEEYSIPYYTTDEDCTSLAEFQTLLKNPQYNQVIVGTMFPKEFGLAACYFPQLVKFEEGVTLENAVLKRSVEPVDAELYYTNIEFGSARWPIGKSNVKADAGSYFMNGRWGVSCSFLLDSVLENSCDVIEFYGAFEDLSENEADVILILEFFKNGEKLKWTGVSSKDITDPSEKEFQVVNGQQFYQEDEMQPDSVFAYISNKSESHLRIKQLGIRVRKGNPNKYALYNRFKD